MAGIALAFCPAQLLTIRVRVGVKEHLCHGIFNRRRATVASGRFAGAEPAGKQTKVIVISTAMLTFISFWRAAAIVLCDMASTAYYIGGIVEQAVGRSAPYFILAVMLFSYAVRAVYVESCSMFTRGGVYRVVKEAMGGDAGEAVGLGPDVRLHPDRSDQRSVGRPIPGRV